MPVTPFHFGVGLLGKGVAPRAVSLCAFVASQVVIDCESAYFLFVARAEPVHRVLHTFALATPVGALVGLAVWAVGRGVRWPPALDWLRSDCALRPALVGGLLGGLTHPLLDGIMHDDIRPFRPFSDANPLLDAMGLGPLHLACVLLGAAGVALLALRVARDLRERLVP
ncbi:MAG: hypothetical protein ABW221_11620 [Vicinamibacteria bacterium]